MGIKNIIFDLDGTLLDTTDGIIKSVQHVVRTLGYDELPHETMLKFVGPPIQDSFVEFYGCNLRNAQNAADLFRDYYKKNALFDAVPYAGVFEMCNELRIRGNNIAVATYKREDYALSLLKHYGFDEFCESMHGSDNYNILKKSDIIELCIAELEGERNEFVLVGDTKHDAIGAKTTGINFIGVTYGFGFQTESEVNLYPNIGVAQKPMDVLSIVVKNS